jgi:hypothetical protein
MIAIRRTLPQEMKKNSFNDATYSPEVVIFAGHLTDYFVSNVFDDAPYLFCIPNRLVAPVLKLSYHFGTKF